MAGFDPQIMLGGGQETLSQAPGGRSSAPIGRLASAVQPHHGLIALVLLAVIIVVVLDRAGFRFAVAVGRS